MNRKNLALAGCIVFILAGFYLSSCDVFFPPSQLISSDGIFVSYDQDTVLDELRRNNSDALVSTEGPYPGDNAILDDYVQWNFEDYLLLAEASHKMVWGEGLDGWKLLLVNMAWEGCEQFDDGPQKASWWFMKFGETENGMTRFTSIVLIEPRKNFINARSEEHFPAGSNWKPVELSQLHISLLGALQIAEDNGGTQYRNSVQNNCDISVGLNTTLASYSGWRVSYQVLNQDTITYFINPVSGRIDN